MMAGDFNVAPDPNKDTLGYLHVNNPNSRNFIERMKSLCMLREGLKKKIIIFMEFSKKGGGRPFHKYYYFRKGKKKYLLK